MRGSGRRWWRITNAYMKAIVKVRMRLERRFVPDSSFVFWFAVHILRSFAAVVRFVVLQAFKSKSKTTTNRNLKIQRT